MTRTGSVFGFDPVFRAWRQCAPGESGIRSAERDEIGSRDHLVKTARMLEYGTSRPSRVRRVVVRHPTAREILAAEFGDRVVHHVLVPWFERLFEPVFIPRVLRTDATSLVKSPSSGCSISPRRVDRPSGVTSMASQCRYFRRRYPGAPAVAEPRPVPGGLSPAARRLVATRRRCAGRTSGSGCPGRLAGAAWRESAPCTVPARAAFLPDHGGRLFARRHEAAQPALGLYIPGQPRGGRCSHREHSDVPDLQIHPR